jgi:catechol 2,3-dioxygenase-like lactoylglutathione lyase family enzyme
LLGRFLEFSLPTRDIQDSLGFYGKLGFSEAQVGETWTHPYAVVTDGRINLGLHQAGGVTEPTLTFVKPELLKHVGILEARGIEFEYRRLGNDVFNEVAWREPDGHLLRLIEARTFSPTKRASTQTSQIGYFAELALPSERLDAAKAYWENLGFVGMDELDGRLPRITCTSDFIGIGLYEPAALRRAGLRFEVGDLAATLSTLAAAGIEPIRDAVLKGPRAALLLAPEGTPLLLVADG